MTGPTIESAAPEGWDHADTSTEAADEPYTYYCEEARASGSPPMTYAEWKALPEPTTPGWAKIDDKGATPHGCTYCGATEFVRLVVNQEHYVYRESSGQYECDSSEYLEDVGEVERCGSCNEPWTGATK